MKDEGVELAIFCEWASQSMLMPVCLIDLVNKSET